MADTFNLDAKGLAATLGQVSTRETIRPFGFDKTIPDTRPSVLDASLEPLAPRLVFGTTIGQGGMAVVRVATQTSLGREVAVKATRADATDEASPRLLREAWITGMLEHPNIVPVHDLGTDERGRPMLVLKRIEGRPWSELLATSDETWNLQTLVQVCHAIAFAHSKGVLHRDLKPDNVMIGGFGEVYVLDWGIAVSLVDDGTGRLPLASTCTELAGTLGYMAPEMLGGGALTERTDVYLLGAILYEIATGKPPHVKDSAMAAITSIASDVEVPPEVAEELAAICRRALAKDPAERYASADELRAALEAFLEHRGSSEIARDANERLRELEAHLAVGTIAPGGADETSSGASRVRTHQLFGQARFGFQAALRAWPGNAAARAGLDRALSTMARYELDQGEPHMASILIADLSTPDAELSTRLAEVERTIAEKAARLARVDADQDVSRGSLARGLFAALFALAWVLMPVFADLLPSIEMDHPTGLLVTSLSIVVVIVVMIAARRFVLATAINRGLVLAVLISLVLHAATEAICWKGGVAIYATHLIAIGQWAGICAMAAVFIDRALVLPTIGFFVTLAVSLAMPGKHLWAISASFFLVFVSVVYIWMTQSRGRRLGGIVDVLRRSD